MAKIAPNPNVAAKGQSRGPFRFAAQFLPAVVGKFYQATFSDTKLIRMLCVASTLALVLAILAGCYWYPSTYGQPDFGYALGVMLTIGNVFVMSFPGLVLAIVGLWKTKARSALPWLLCAAHLMLCVGVPLTFKLKYKPNEPLLRSDTGQRATIFTRKT